MQAVCFVVLQRQKLMQGLVTWAHTHTYTCTQTYTKNHTEIIYLCPYLQQYIKLKDHRKENVYKTLQLYVGQWRMC